LVPRSGIVLTEQPSSLSSDPVEDASNHDLRPRHVLIVEGEPSIRNVFYVLLAGLGCEGDIAHTGHQALAMIKKESFDAVLLDLRCSEMPAGEMVSAISELRPNLVGRVLVITGEVSDPLAMEMIKNNCWPHIPRQRVMQELWGRLCALLGLSESPADSAS
jgi:DNA-binding NtrC family response regulator